MKLDRLEPITATYGKAVILSDDTPASLEIDGSDVDDMPADYKFAPGSEIITPTGNYVAFEDGVFTAIGAADSQGGD